MQTDEKKDWMNECVCGKKPTFGSGTSVRVSCVCMRHTRWYAYVDMAVAAWNRGEFCGPDGDFTNVPHNEPPRRENLELIEEQG